MCRQGGFDEEEENFSYLGALDDDGVFVVEQARSVLCVDRPDVLFLLPRDDHDLPFASIFRDATELGPSMAPRLHQNRLVFTFNQHCVIVGLLR